jgi:hypothetical protein
VLAGRYYVLYAVLWTVFLPLRIWIKACPPAQVEAWKRQQQS